MEITSGFFYFSCRARRGHHHPRNSLLFVRSVIHDSRSCCGIYHPRSQFRSPEPHHVKQTISLGRSSDRAGSHQADLVFGGPRYSRRPRRCLEALPNCFHRRQGCFFCSVKSPRRATFDAYGFDTASSHVKGKPLRSPQFAGAQYGEDEGPFSPCLFPHVRGSSIHRILHQIYGFQRP